MLRRKDSARRKTRKCLASLDDVLMTTIKLKFTSQQLLNLNFYFDRKLDESSKCHVNAEKMPQAVSTVERLIQRLVCGVGLLDSNFSSKYLIPLHDDYTEATTLQYLLRLDNLSTPTLYRSDPQPAYLIVENDPDFPKGYARIRMQPAMMQEWGVYTNHQGYLRRDKIQTKYAELLATTANSDVCLIPSDLDESTLCASPGKIVNACTLRKILKRPAKEHVYFGGHGNMDEFPDTRDFRLAIVDEPNGIRIRLEFLSSNLASMIMTVRLLLGIESDAWPAFTNFPARIPLGHPDALLYNQAGQMGAYFVGYGVQSSGWQVRFPATEDYLMNHYSNNSAVRSILRVGTLLLEDIYEHSPRHQKYEYTYRIANQYTIKTMLMDELEKDFTNPTRLILNWSPRMLSGHVLKIFDQLVYALRIQRLPNYFYPDANLLVNPGHLCEDDYANDSRIITEMLMQLYHLSIGLNTSIEFERFNVSQEVEVLLLQRFKDIIDGLLPSSSTRGRRFWFSAARTSVTCSQYSNHQLEFLSDLFRSALNAHKHRIAVLYDEEDESKPMDSFCHNDRAHDLVYIVVILLRQAKEHFLKSNPSGRVRRRLSIEFAPCLLRLVETIRTARESYIDGVDFVKLVLQWLYRVMDKHKRILTPLLRPYLNILFVTSHGNACFLNDIRSRAHSTEVDALALYNKLVSKARITPAEGLVDCFKKKWIWAKDFLDAIREQPVTVAFVPKRGKVVRHVMSAPEAYEDELNANSILQKSMLNSNGNNTANNQELHFSTLSQKSYFYSFINTYCCKPCDKQTSKPPLHCVLRDSSPLTVAFQHIFRRGDHRCSGDILLTILSMHKMSIMNEITMVLPEDDRNQLVEILQKFYMQRSKSMMRMRAKTGTALGHSMSCEHIEKYTPLDENAAMELSKDNSVCGSNATIEMKSSRSMRSTSSGSSSQSNNCDNSGRAFRLQHSQSMKF